MVREIQPSVLLMALFLVMLAGCSSTNGSSFRNVTTQPPRMIKVSFVGQHDSFRIRANQESVQTVENSEYTNLMVRLNLGYGDIVVWEDQRDDSGKELSQPKDISDWWFKYLKQTRTSFYSIPQQRDFFSTQIFHWIAPFNPPRPISEAKFFENGQLLGIGMNGFQNMVKKIEAVQSGFVLICAPRIKNEGQASPWIANDQLLVWSKEAGLAKEFEGVLSHRVVEFTDFGRFMDDD